MTEHDIKIADRYWTEMKAWSSSSLGTPWSFQFNVLLISSFLYYQMNSQILSDEDFDKLCAHLLNNFDDVMAANVWHKALLNRDSLRAGTMFDIKASSYPPVVIMVAYDLLRRIEAEKPEEEMSYVGIDTSRPRMPSSEKKKALQEPPKEPSFADLFS